jgi:hypothetical protein
VNDNTRELLQALGDALGALPPLLQAAADGDPWPMAVGTHEVLVSKLVEAGVEPGDAERLSQRALRAVSRAPRYLEALADDQPGYRYNLDGTRAAQVGLDQRASAAQLILSRALRASAKAHGTPSSPPAPKPAPTPKPKAVEPTPQPKPPSFAGGTLSLPAARRPGVAVRRR